MNCNKKIFIKERDLKDHEGPHYICKQQTYFTKSTCMQEILMTQYINKIDFPFVQKMIDYEITDSECKIRFEFIDSDNIHEIETDAKFICYVVMKFIIMMHQDHDINHNDLSTRNVMFNHRSKYQFRAYDSLALPEYVPVIIDFELSQKFTENNKILIDFDSGYFNKYNINHNINPIYQDVYKFLKTMIYVADRCGSNLTNKEYPQKLYDRIFDDKQIKLKDHVYMILDLNKLKSAIKIKDLNDLLKQEL